MGRPAGQVVCEVDQCFRPI